MAVGIGNGFWDLFWALRVTVVWNQHVFWLLEPIYSGMQLLWVLISLHCTSCMVRLPESNTCFMTFPPSHLHIMV